MQVAEDEIGSVTDSKDVNLSRLLEMVEDRGDWHATFHGITKNLTLFNN